MALQAEQSPAGWFSSQENWSSEPIDAWGPVCVWSWTRLSAPETQTTLSEVLCAFFDATGVGSLHSVPAHRA